jgi:hypothetical protein
MYVSRNAWAYRNDPPYHILVDQSGPKGQGASDPFWNEAWLTTLCRRTIRGRPALIVDYRTGYPLPICKTCAKRAAQQAK